MKHETKRIRFIETMASVRQSFIRGREYDLPADEAQSFITNGCASEVTGEPAQVAIQQALASDFQNAADASKPTPAKPAKQSKTK